MQIYFNQRFCIFNLSKQYIERETKIEFGNIHRFVLTVKIPLKVQLTGDVQQRLPHPYKPTHLNRMHFDRQ
uniref:Uncharacterized protein n=1 Tax=Anguilla anguilla TaxID=7936 RepID=A0A0E9WFB1_ANGAN